MKHPFLKKVAYAALLGLSLTFSFPAFAGTGVYVNGRELTASQLFAVIRATGTVPARGSYLYNPSTGYWINRNTGATGRIGSSYGNGGGGGGDRFWSTGFSAGNSTRDNSQGYVSVPGYGPVGYGM